MYGDEIIRYDYKAIITTAETTAVQKLFKYILTTIQTAFQQRKQKRGSNPEAGLEQQICQLIRRRPAEIAGDIPGGKKTTDR